MKVLKVKKTPKPKSTYNEVIPFEHDHDDDHHDEGKKVDNSPKEEGDDTDENKDILQEPPAAPAPIPVLKDQPIVDANPAILQPKKSKSKESKEVETTQAISGRKRS